MKSMPSKEFRQAKILAQQEFERTIEVQNDYASDDYTDVRINLGLLTARFPEKSGKAGAVESPEIAHDQRAEREQRETWAISPICGFKQEEKTKTTPVTFREK